MNTFLGAEIGTIAKAKAMQIAIEKSFGVRPAMDVKEKKVVLYYPQNKMSAARDSFKRLLNAPESDVQFKYTPVVAPVLIKENLPLIIGAVVVLAGFGFIVGSKKRRG